MKKLIFILIILASSLSVCEAQISRIFKGHTDYVDAVAFSPGGKYVASGGFDETIKVWDLENGKIINSINVNDKVFKLYFSSDTRNICAGTVPLRGISTVLDSLIFVYDLFNGNRNSEMLIKSKSPNFYLPFNGNNLITIVPELYLDSCKYSYDYDFKKYSESKCYKLLLNKYDLSSKTCDSNIFIEYMAAWNFNSPYVISENGKYIAVCSIRDNSGNQFHKSVKNEKQAEHKEYKNYIFVFDIENKKLINHIEIIGGYLGQKNILLTNNGSYFCYTAKQYFNDVIKIIDIKKYKEISTLSGHSREILCLAIHPGGKYIASGSKDNTIRIWNIYTGKEVTVLEGHSDNVNYVTFSADGRYLASASDDKTVRVWNLSSISSDIEIYALKYDIEKGLDNFINEEKNAETRNANENNGDNTDFDDIF